MKFAFLVGNPQAQAPGFTTVVLMHEAARRGHTVSLLGVDDLMLDADGRVCGRVCGRVRSVSAAGADAGATLGALLDAPAEWASLAEVDVLLLRLLARPKGLDEDDGRYDTWYRGRIEAALAFAQQVRAGSDVRVLNDPIGLWQSSGKLLLGELPDRLAPRTCISRDATALREFVGRYPQGTVLKALMGHGGEDVFLVRPDDPNLNAALSTLRRQGFVVAQEYLPAAEHGERRLLLLNGEPIESGDGRAAIYLRKRTGDDWRTNMRVGATPEHCELSERDREIAATLQPMLRARGQWLVGVDVIGGKVLEVNAFCPGGLSIARKLTGFDAAVAVIDDLEHGSA